MNFFPNWHRPLVFLIVSIFVMLAATNDVAAQTAGQATVILRTGEKVKGLIIEAVPDQFIKLRTSNGNILTVNADNIRQIRTKESTLEHRSGLAVSVGVDAAYELGGLNYQMIQPRLVLGGCSRGNAWGVSFSFLYGISNTVSNIDKNYHGVASRNEIVYVPVSFNYRKEFGKKRFRPVVDVSAGYPLHIGKKYVGIPTEERVNFASYYHFPVNSQLGLFYGAVQPGIAVKFGQIRVALLLKYSFMAFSEKFSIEKSLGDDEYNRITIVGSSNYQKRNQLINSVGIGFSIFY